MLKGDIETISVPTSVRKKKVLSQPQFFTESLPIFYSMFVVSMKKLKVL